MISDIILKLLGTSPIGYYDSDKWSVVLAILINNDHFFMPWILGAIPIIWLLIRKYRRKHISTVMIIIAAAATIGLCALGFVLLDWLSELAFGLSYQRMYGDLF